MMAFSPWDDWVFCHCDPCGQTNCQCLLLHELGPSSNQCLLLHELGPASRLEFFSRPDVGAARREVSLDSCSTTSTQVNTQLQQQQICLLSAGRSWYFIYIVLQSSPSATSSYSHSSFQNVPLPLATGSYIQTSFQNSLSLPPPL